MSGHSGVSQDMLSRHLQKVIVSSAVPPSLSPSLSMHSLHLVLQKVGTCGPLSSLHTRSTSAPGPPHCHAWQQCGWGTSYHSVHGQHRPYTQDSKQNGCHNPTYPAAGVLLAFPTPPSTVDQVLLHLHHQQ